MQAYCLRYGLEQAKALLIVDGHNSCESPISTQLLRDNNIDCICLPAHSSTVLQPMDLSVNGMFKYLLGKHFQVVAHEEKALCCIHLLNVAGMCLDAAYSVLHVMTGFARSGIWPLQPEVPFKSSLVRDPTTQYVPECRQKKKLGVEISNKVLTDGKTISPIILPTTLPTPQIAAPPQRKKQKKNAPILNENTLVVNVL